MSVCVSIDHFPLWISSQWIFIAQRSNDIAKRCDGKPIERFRIVRHSAHKSKVKVSWLDLILWFDRRNLNGRASASELRHSSDTWIARNLAFTNGERTRKMFIEKLEWILNGFYGKYMWHDHQWKIQQMKLVIFWFSKSFVFFFSYSYYSECSSSGRSITHMNRLRNDHLMCCVWNYFFFYFAATHWYIQKL